MESTWCVIWSGKAIALQATWACRTNLLLFLVLPCHQQWLFIDVICSHRTRHCHLETSLLTHIIPMKNLVRPRHFIKWVRPGWPGQNVTRFTRMIRMTRPSCNAVMVTLVIQYVVNACQEDQNNAVVATEGTPNSSNKTEHFSYKGAWVNT